MEEVLDLCPRLGDRLALLLGEKHRQLIMLFPNELYRLEEDFPSMFSRSLRPFSKGGLRSINGSSRILHVPQGNAVHRLSRGRITYRIALPAQGVNKLPINKHLCHPTPSFPT